MTRPEFGITPPPGKRDWMYKPALAQEHSATSKEAAAKIEPSRWTLRARVFAFIKESGGATDEEGIAGTGIPASTYRPRRVELVESASIIDSGTTRRTKAGFRAVVWVARV